MKRGRLLLRKKELADHKTQWGLKYSRYKRKHTDCSSLWYNRFNSDRDTFEKKTIILKIEGYEKKIHLQY